MIAKQWSAFNNVFITIFLDENKLVAARRSLRYSHCDSEYRTGIFLILENGVKNQLKEKNEDGNYGRYFPRLKGATFNFSYQIATFTPCNVWDWFSFNGTGPIHLNHAYDQKYAWYVVQN